MVINKYLIIWKFPLDGRMYDGFFKNDKRHGFGTYTFADGRVYSGFWKKGKMHGKGKFINAQNETREGLWDEG